MSSTNIIQGWPNSAIVGLATLLFTAIAAPLGWMVHRYWVKGGQSNSCPVSESNHDLMSQSIDTVRLAAAGTMADSQRGEELADLERGT